MFRFILYGIGIVLVIILANAGRVIKRDRDLRRHLSGRVIFNDKK